MFLLATSPGQRGAIGVLSDALEKFPYQGAKVAGSFSLPYFNDNFNDEGGILDEELLALFQQQLANFEKTILEDKVAEEA